MKRLTRMTVNAVVGLLACALFAFSSCQEKKAMSANIFPDGTPIPEWFLDTVKIDPVTFGKWYSIAEYGAVADDSTMNTEAIQRNNFV